MPQDLARGLPLAVVMQGFRMVRLRRSMVMQAVMKIACRCSPANVLRQERPAQHAGDADQQAAEQELAEVEQQYQQLLEQAGVCPMCRQTTRGVA